MRDASVVDLMPGSPAAQSLTEILPLARRKVARMLARVQYLLIRAHCALSCMYND